MKGISVLIKEIRESFLPLLPCEDTTVRTVCEPGVGLSPDIRSAVPWSWVFPPPET